jgi:hypothetical protein
MDFPDAATSPQWSVSSLQAALADIFSSLCKDRSRAIQRASVHRAAPALLCDPTFPDFVVHVKNIISASDSTKFRW